MLKRLLSNIFKLAIYASIAVLLLLLSWMYLNERGIFAPPPIEDETFAKVFETSPAKIADLDNAGEQIMEISSTRVSAEKTNKDIFQIQGPPAGTKAAIARRVVAGDSVNAPVVSVANLERIEGAKLPIISPKTVAKNISPIRVVIVDAITLQNDGNLIRLNHIASPGNDHLCARGTAVFPCANLSKSALRRRIRQRRVVCDFESIKETGEPSPLEARFADCSVANSDLAHWLVAQGWVLAKGEVFAKTAAKAREARLGIWAPDVEPPT